MIESSNLKWPQPDSLLSGIIILTKNNQLNIEIAQPEVFYEQSKEESFAIITGPLLLSNSTPVKLPDMGFSNKRHPRSCMCKTKDSIILIAVDGRSEKADGMTLAELQDFLLDMGCIDAINLDGGGSTTLWTKENGIINNPSDKQGERPVDNAILIVKK